MVVWLAGIKDPKSCDGWDVCPRQVLPCRIGRRVEALEVGLWVNNPLLEKNLLQKPKLVQPLHPTLVRTTCEAKNDAQTVNEIAVD